MASSKTNGLVGGFGQGMAQVGLLMMQDNMEETRQKRLAALTADAEAKTHARDKEETWGADNLGGTKKIENDRAMAAAELEANAKVDAAKAVAGVKGGLTEADRIKGLNGELADIDKAFRESQTDPDKNPMTEEQLSSAVAMAKKRWSGDTGSTGFNPDKAKEAAAKISAMMNGNKPAEAAGANPGLIEDATPSPQSVKPEEKGLIDEMITGAPGNRQESAKDEYTRLEATLKAGGGGRSQADIQKIKDRMAELESQANGGDLVAKLDEANKLVTSANGDVISRDGKVFMTAAEKKELEAKVAALKK